MKISELKNKSVGDLQNLLQEYRDKERDLRFRIAADQTKNVREIRTVKKTIARLLTLLRQMRPLRTKTPS